jgi:hypothetical protein
MVSHLWPLLLNLFFCFLNTSSVQYYADFAIQMSVHQRVCAAGITTAAAYASFKFTTSSDKQDPRPYSSLLRSVLPVIRAQEPAPVPNDAVPADSVLMPKPVQSPYAACELSCFVLHKSARVSRHTTELA